MSERPTLQGVRDGNAKPSVWIRRDYSGLQWLSLTITKAGLASAHDPSCTRILACSDHDEQLHQIVIDVARPCRLQDLMTRQSEVWDPSYQNVQVQAYENVFVSHALSDGQGNPGLLSPAYVALSAPLTRDCCLYKSTLAFLVSSEGKREIVYCKLRICDLDYASSVT